MIVHELLNSEIIQLNNSPSYRSSSYRNIDIGHIRSETMDLL